MPDAIASCISDTCAPLIPASNCLNNAAHDSCTFFGSFRYSSSIASRYDALAAFTKSSRISRFGVGFGVAALALAFPLAPIPRESIRRRSNALVAPRARANARDASATLANPRDRSIPGVARVAGTRRAGVEDAANARDVREKAPSARRRACAEDMAGPRARSSVDR